MTRLVAGNPTVKPSRKLKDEHYRFIDECMANNELTATNDGEIAIAECKGEKSEKGARLGCEDEIWCYDIRE